MHNSILLNTLKGVETSRPPVWFMRQAGRVLPSYLDLRSRYSFWQLMKDPGLASKVTLLPVDDLGVDAAILFSDILVIPYAMGMGLDFTDEGPKFEVPLIETADPLERLSPDPSKLEYIYRAIDETVKSRPPGIPLIGFAGAPFTVMCYMLEGLSSKKEFRDAVAFIYNNISLTEKITGIVTDLTIEYAEKQISHGIDVFQLFDTHAGVLPFDFYKRMFLPAVERISAAVRDKGVPFIFFPKGIGAGLEEIKPELCDFAGIDWQTPIEKARKMVHKGVGLQGNFDPRILFAGRPTIEKELEKYLEFGRREKNWIFNLGHGFMPGVPFENARFVVDWVKSANWNRR